MPITFKGLRETELSYRNAAAVMAKAEARAVRRVGVTIAAMQARAIAQRENLRIGAIKDAIKTVRQPTPDQPRVVFEVRAKAIPLGQFIGTRMTKKGISTQPLKSSPRAVLRAGFQLRSGVFVGRAAKAGRKYGSPHVGRTPIVKLFGPNVLSQYIRDEIQKLGADTWNERLPIELDRESTNALRQAGLL